EGQLMSMAGQVVAADSFSVRLDHEWSLQHWHAFGASRSCTTVRGSLWTPKAWHPATHTWSRPQPKSRLGRGSGNGSTRRRERRHLPQAPQLVGPSRNCVAAIRRELHG